MLTHTAKLLISFSLSFLSVGLYVYFRGNERSLCMIAMLLSTVGDLFMTDTFNMGAASTYPGAAGFILAHIVYAVCFVKAGKDKGYRLANRGLYAGMGLTLAVVIVLTVLMFKITGSIQGMYFPLLAYLAIIGLNLCCQFSYAVNEKGLRYFLIVGMSLFIISDMVVFLPMLNISPEHNDFVWATYAPAQLLIILFNSDMRKQK